MDKLFKGIIAYPITPFTNDNQVDIGIFKALTEELVINGAHGIAPLGSTGVLPYLTDEEKQLVITATIEQVSGRVPVLAGVSNLTTEKTIYHAQFAERSGATAVMIIPMSYWKLTETEIFSFYDEVASKITLPIMAYNNPATGGIDMSPTLLKRLLQIPNVTMIKESTGDIQRMHHLRKALGDDVDFFNGSNPLALAAFAAGATGWCTAAPNLIPNLNNRLYQLIVQQDLSGAREVYYQQFDLLQFIVAHGLPRTIQAGLTILGKAAGHLRKPLLALPEAEFQRLTEILETLQQFETGAAIQA